MTIAEKLLPELDQEMKTTRRLLERVPSEKADWKPHPKSFSLAHLTQLVATMPGWITQIVRDGDIDLAKSEPYRNQDTESLVRQFDRHVQESRAAVAGMSDEQFGTNWSLKRGDQVLMTMTRDAVVRQTINHFCHHRGQLTVYLRMLDVPIPSIYGPTADESW
jgi:uncharacterized damage-inducible protein DinB